VTRFSTAGAGVGVSNRETADEFATARRLHTKSNEMKSESRLQKSGLAKGGRAVLVMAVIVAWTIAIAGIMHDRASDTTADDKAPTKPYYSFSLEVNV
jgi:hypothetical protein